MGKAAWARFSRGSTTSSSGRWRSSFFSPSEIGPEHGARLHREAKARAQLSHPNVVQVYEVGTWQDQLFIAMELVEGRTLKAWLTEQPRSLDEILQMFISAGAGLAAAHDRELIHRDFKPDNVLALALAVCEGNIRRPENRRGPRRLRAAMTRRLAVPPDERWPGMQALLHELESIRSAPVRRRRAVVAVGSLSIAAVAAMWSVGRPDADPVMVAPVDERCRPAAERFAGRRLVADQHRGLRQR